MLCGAFVLIGVSGARRGSLREPPAAAKPPQNARFAARNARARPQQYPRSAAFRDVWDSAGRGKAAASQKKFHAALIAFCAKLPVLIRSC